MKQDEQTGSAHEQQHGEAAGNPEEGNWESDADADLKAALAAVRFGHDPVAAKNLMRHFRDSIAKGRAYNRRVLEEYLLLVFGKILDSGASADQALGLRLEKGKYPRPDTYDRDLMAAAYMTLLLRNNWTWLDARGEACNLLFPEGKGEKAAEDAYARYKESLACEMDTFLMGMLPPGTPPIRPFMRV